MTENEQSSGEHGGWQQAEFEFAFSGPQHSTYTWLHFFRCVISCGPQKKTHSGSAACVPRLWMGSYCLSLWKVTVKVTLNRWTTAEKDGICTLHLSKVEQKKEFKKCTGKCTSDYLIVSNIILFIHHIEEILKDILMLFLSVFMLLNVYIHLRGCVDCSIEMFSFISKINVNQLFLVFNWHVSLMCCRLVHLWSFIQYE